MNRVAALLGAGLLLAGAAAAQPSAPGTSLLAALETAPVAALARVGNVQAIDASGYAATLTVVRPLRGTAADARLTVLWEELARGRLPRLADGQTIVVALDDAPAGSLWRQRRRDRPEARAIAANGDALLPVPPARDVEWLANYAALPTDATAARRAAALVDLAAGASPPLAGAALDRLTVVPTLTAAMADAGLLALLATAADTQRPRALRIAIVALAGAARRPASRPPLAQLARPGSDLEADALGALAAVDGGLPPARAEALLDRPEPALRAIGARFASGNAVERRLPALVRGDPDPSVRAAAATALAATHTEWGVAGCLPALSAPTPSVRATAAGALGAIGAPVVPTLEDVARARPDQARGAMTALALAGPTGEQALRRLSVELPDPHLRDFARLALGQGPHAH